MRMMNYSIMRCVSAIAIGILLMVWPETAIIYLVIAIGAMFFLPSLFTIIGYFMKGRQLGMYFPIVSLGSLLFGLWLMVSPAFFVGILMYVLGAVLVFAGVSQIAGLLGGPQITGSQNAHHKIDHHLRDTAHNQPACIFCNFILQ